eukprot:COSAG05_NODE_3086_length_2335_cov_258.283989_2_plen_82_part_00
MYLHLSLSLSLNDVAVGCRRLNERAVGLRHELDEHYGPLLAQVRARSPTCSYKSLSLSLARSLCVLVTALPVTTSPEHDGY